MGRYDALTELDKETRSAVSLQKTESKATRKPETLKSGNTESPKSGKPEIILSGKPETLKSRKPEAVEKYSTMLPPSLVKRIKRYALEYDLDGYEVVQAAVEEYLDKNL